MKNFIRRVGLALATGYLFFFYSERVFWSFLRPDESLAGLIFGWLVYSLIAYMTLVVIEYFRVRSMPALFLAGAIFGWIVEGIYAMTFFGVGGMPLPITFAWTALAWHALISVVIGWYYLRLSMAKRSYFHTLGFSALLGLFWGVWAVAWGLEEVPLYAGYDMFLIHALVATLFFAFAMWISGKVQPGSFTSTKTERWVLGAIALLYMALVTFPTVTFLLPLLVISFALAFYPLWKHRQLETGPTVLLEFEHPVRFGKYLCLFVMPVVATFVYLGLNNAGLVFPSNIGTFVVTSLLSTCFFFASMYLLLKKKQSSLTASAVGPEA